MDISEPYSGVLHLEFTTRKDMTLTMARVQEYYESPYSSIKGKYFTWAQFIEAYTDDAGNLTYFQEWEGFNVPRSYLVSFRNLFTDLSDREKLLLETLRTGFGYLIATDTNSDPSTLQHELAHAKYALDPVYRNTVDAILCEIPEALQGALCHDLLEADYPSDVLILMDEVHAYLKTSTEEELLETFPSVPVKDRVEWEKRLRSV